MDVAAASSSSSSSRAPSAAAAGGVRKPKGRSSARAAADGTARLQARPAGRARVASMFAVKNMAETLKIGRSADPACQRAIDSGDRYLQELVRRCVAVTHGDRRVGITYQDVIYASGVQGLSVYGGTPKAMKPAHRTKAAIERKKKRTAAAAAAASAASDNIL